MRLLRCFAIVLLILSSASAMAQGTDIKVWASWLELGSQDFEDPEFNVSLEFESGVGFGVGLNRFWWDRFSTELAVMALDADAQLEAGDGEFDLEFDLGSLDLTPIMLTGQFHFAPDSRFDPYLGIGAAYVLIDDLEPDPRLEIGSVEVDDEFTFLVNAGFDIAITPNFGINLDARYIPLEPASQAVDDPEEIDLELNPLIVSAGLRWRFGGR